MLDSRSFIDIAYMSSRRSDCWWLNCIKLTSRQLYSGPVNLSSWSRMEKCLPWHCWLQSPVDWWRGHCGLWHAWIKLCVSKIQTSDSCGRHALSRCHTTCA